jgi:hypothetical protein
MTENAFAKAQLDKLYERHPELFPVGFDQGYALCGFTEPSRKQQLRCRRIRLSTDTRVWTLAPAVVMPYMTAVVSEVDKALLLMRFHVPCWALAHVFGRDAMYWYRLQQSLGRFSVVGTTVKAAQRLPQDLVADGKTPAAWRPRRSTSPRPLARGVFSARRSASRPRRRG